MAGVDEQSRLRSDDQDEPDREERTSLPTVGEPQPHHLDPPHRQAVIQLPPLPPGDALRIVDILERVRAAIWEAHGEAMGELLLSRYADRHHPPEHDDAALFEALERDDDLPF